MKKTMVCLLALALLAGLWATGCDKKDSSTEEEGKTERYGMVVFLKGSEFFNWAYAGMRDAAKGLGPGVEVELQGPAEWDARLEAQAVEQLIAKRIDGIVVTAGEANTLIPAINKATAAGIPVVTFDSDSPGSKRLVFCGTENYNAGWEAGKAMAEWLGGKGAVGISTFPGPDHLKKRVEGFRAALAKFAPEIEVAAEVNDEGDQAKAVTQITAMLQANPGIAGVFCAHGNPGPGAEEAVRSLALEGKVQIMGFDFGMPVIERIEKGTIRGTVGQNPYLMGYMALLHAYSAKHQTPMPTEPLGGETYPDFLPAELPVVKDGKIDTGVSILYKDVIDQYKNVPEF